MNHDIYSSLYVSNFSLRSSSTSSLLSFPNPDAIVGWFCFEKKTKKQCLTKSLKVAWVCYLVNAVVC